MNSETAKSRYANHLHGTPMQPIEPTTCYLHSGVSTRRLSGKDSNHPRNSAQFGPKRVRSVAPTGNEVATGAPATLALLHGHAYRVLTTQHRVFDRVTFDAHRLAFLLGPGARGGEPKALPLDAIERVALGSGGSTRAGGERFVPIGECFAEPLTLAGAA